MRAVAKAASDGKRGDVGKRARVLRQALTQSALSPSDIDAVEMKDVHQIKESLVRQLMAPVQWIKVIEKMGQDGCSTFVEVGPGKVLQGLVLKIDKTMQAEGVN
jgi:malonyl CoA-acyl carrier protein transacylase